MAVELAGISPIAVIRDAFLARWNNGCRNRAGLRLKVGEFK
jgi:hypothetical protein